MPQPTSAPARIVADTIIRTVELGVRITDAAMAGETTVLWCDLLTDGPGALPGLRAGRDPAEGFPSVSPFVYRYRVLFPHLEATTKDKMLAEFGKGGGGSHYDPTGKKPPYYTQYRCQQNVSTSTGQIDAARSSAEEAWGAGYSLLGNNCLDRAISVVEAYGANPPPLTNLAPAEGSPYVYFNGALDPTRWGQINTLPGVPSASDGSGGGGSVGGGAGGHLQDLPNVALPNVAAPIPAPAPSIEGTWTLTRHLQSCQHLPDGCASAPFTVRISDCSGSSCSLDRTDGLWHSAHPLTSNGSTWTASFTDVGVACHGQLNNASFSWGLSMDGPGTTLQGEYSYTADSNPPDCEDNALVSFLVTGSRR